MRRKSFLRKPGHKEEMDLQITSMADIFVIILVFMLKSFTAGGTPIETSQSIQVPNAKGRVEEAKALKLEISQSVVAIEGQSVMRIRDFSFAASDLESNGSSRSLQAALSGVRKKNSESPSQKILVVADQRAPYATIKAVLASAALQGYTDIKLAVTDAN